MTISRRIIEVCNARRPILSCVRNAGDFAGVFEYCDDAGYFYLYEMKNSSGGKILDYIFMFFGRLNIVATDISIRWDSSEEKVGLFIGKALWAVFNVRERSKYGGNYRVGARPTLSPQATAGFGIDVV